MKSRMDERSLVTRGDTPNGRWVRVGVARWEAANASAIADAIGEASIGVPAVVIDLTAVTFLDSTAVGALVSRIQAERRAGRPVALCGANPAVERMLRLMFLDRWVPLRSSVDAAFAACEATEPGAGP
jgi:anti-sigma B factor antagonist